MKEQFEFSVAITASLPFQVQRFRMPANSTSEKLSNSENTNNITLRFQNGKTNEKRMNGITENLTKVRTR